MILRLSSVLRVTSILAVVCVCDGFFDRLLPNQQTSTSRPDEPIKIVRGKVKRFDRLTVPLVNYYPSYPGHYNSHHSMWQASATMTSDEPESAIAGQITFQQWPSNNLVKLNINVTGLPPGKHALHIHTFGDISQGCKSTGGQFPNNFIGNVDTNEEGAISSSFLSSYITLFGFHGIVGRSIVVHSKPIDINNSLNAEVFSSSLQAIPENAFQNEENLVGPIIACGVISIVNRPTRDESIPPAAPPPPPSL